jgi:hypothetical protein
MAKQITVTFSGGQVVVKTEGFAGATCLKATDALERDLGLDKTSDERTPEYYHQQTAPTKVGMKQ